MLKSRYYKLIFYAKLCLNIFLIWLLLRLILIILGYKSKRLTATVNPLTLRSFNYFLERSKVF